MTARVVVLTVATSCLVAICTGCAGSRTARANVAAAQANASDDVGRRPDPNAPYILPGGTPRLIPRATAIDTQNAGPCDPEVLSVEEISGDTNGVFRSVKLAFMNRGASPCRLGGYPGVALVDPQGASIGSIVMEKVTSAEVVAELSHAHPADLNGPAPMITLMPHSVAAFQVVWTSGAECSRVGRIVVTAPGTERAFSVNQPMKICTGRIQVTELRLDEGDV